MKVGVGQVTLHCKSRRHKLPYEIKILKSVEWLGLEICLKVLPYYLKYIDPNSSITMACKDIEKYLLKVMEAVYLGRYQSVFMDLKTFMPEFVKKLYKTLQLDEFYGKILQFERNLLPTKNMKSAMVLWSVPLIFVQYFRLKKVVAESLEAARWQGQC
ncbi:hypothetical protein AVEN_255840-1 [Araneus ventricosus]|uniref:Uncharacterized protein n=1 Tax=Araneus ventricosus TaxID=182803 RepID=A0A4Y2EJS2_ARAVE|nr:hypothetical protein AVEN_255840-1 [Araneus ventricosus]